MTGVASNEVVLFDLPQFSIQSRILNVCPLLYSTKKCDVLLVIGS